MPLDSRNLVWRALDAVRQVDGQRWGMDVWIDKRIPSQAGMGGGSSDAAAAIVAGMALWRRAYDSELAGSIAARLGSDVNFFLEGNLGRTWTAACQSRGERVRPISIGHPMHLVIAHPPQGCSTADVFRALVLPEKKSSIESVFDVLKDGNLSQLSSVLFNRLEKAAETQSHWIEKHRLAFSKVKAMAHVMTGSGSARFGICASASHAITVARILSSLLPGAVYAARSWNAPAIEQQLSALGYLSKSTAKPMDLGRSGCGNH
jgi:4-diphosphocytidyl-2-C-methyl-D-erythritol kinase